MRRSITPAVRVNTTAVLESMNYVKTHASSSGRFAMAIPELTFED